MAYCATCDGEFFTGKTIFVVGGGYAAVEEGLFLTKYAKNLIVVVRGNDFSIESAAVEELKDNKNTKILYHTQIEEVKGDSAIRKVVLKDRQTGEETVYEADPSDFYGVFVFVGYAPENALLKGKSISMKRDTLLPTVTRKQMLTAFTQLVISVSRTSDRL